MRRTARGQDALSKTLSWLLRHSAVKEGLRVSSDGYVSVDEILQHKCLRQRYTLQDIKRVVEENDKKRFTLSTHPETGELLIKANQGHSMREVKDHSLIPITSALEAPVVVHGTYRRHWDSISKEGLKRMNRLHVHFAPGEPGDEEVISGMRSSCEVYIYVDIAKALADGIKFYRSANNVILSPGDENGIIDVKYFSRIVHRCSRGKPQT